MTVSQQSFNRTTVYFNELFMTRVVEIAWLQFCVIHFKSLRLLILYKFYCLFELLAIFPYLVDIKLLLGLHGHLFCSRISFSRGFYYKNIRNISFLFYLLFTHFLFCLLSYSYLSSTSRSFNFSISFLPFSGEILNKQQQLIFIPSS